MGASVKGTLESACPGLHAFACVYRRRYIILMCPWICSMSHNDLSQLRCPRAVYFYTFTLGPSPPPPPPQFKLSSGGNYFRRLIIITGANLLHEAFLKFSAAVINFAQAMCMHRCIRLREKIVFFILHI